MYSFYCYVVGPEDSVYRYKLLKLKFDIPPMYPLKHPEVKFIQHRGERIHPNFYTNGKVCLSILGTWEGEPWATSMTTDSVLRTCQSLLDNDPYEHEPSRIPDPDYAHYVRYTTWQWLLLDYVARESDPEAKAWLQRFLATNGADMTTELRRQQDAARQRWSATGPISLRSSYISIHEVVMEDYPSLLRQLESEIEKAKLAVEARESEAREAVSAESASTPAPVTESIASGPSSSSLKRSIDEENGPVPDRGEAGAEGPSGSPTARTDAGLANPPTSAEQPPKKRAKKDTELINLN